MTIFEEIKLNKLIKYFISQALDLFRYWAFALIKSTELKPNKVYAFECSEKFENQIIKYRFEIEVINENIVSNIKEKMV